MTSRPSIVQRIDSAIHATAPSAAGCPENLPCFILFDSEFAILQYSYMTINKVARALNCEKRLQVLEWLRDPRTHFLPQMDGDLVEDGVCVVLIAEKLKVTQPTATEHLKILADAGLVTAKRIKQWTFYRRDEEGIRRARETVLQQL